MDTTTFPHAPDDHPRSTTRRRGARLLAGATAALSLLTACGSGGGDGGAGGATTPATALVTTPPEATDAAPTTAPGDVADPATAPETPLLDELLATRGEDGAMPLDGALTAFAAVYGALPGVEPSTLAAEGIEGTTAARWLAAHHDALTDEQRAAVDAAMSPLDIDGTPLAPSDAPAPAPDPSTSPMPSTSSPGQGWRSAARPELDLFGPRGCFGGSFTFEDAPGAGKYRDIVRLALAEVRLLLGPLGIPVYTAFSDFEGVNADLNPWAPDCDEPAQACQIRLAPLALQMEDSALVKTLAHELTHCYQARALGATAISTLPDWLIEGFPSFVGETVGVSIGNTTPNYWWDKWFSRHGVQLYGRTYDALGFYAVVEQAGGNPFGRYLTALRTRDSSAAFQHLIGGVQEQVGTIWGATHFRQVERGLSWDLNGPGVTPYRPAIGTSIVANGGGYATALYEAQSESTMFDLRAEVVVVELKAPAKGRYSFTGAADEILTGTREWCTLGYPCVCPEGTPKAGTVVEQAPGTQLAIGVAGTATGGTLHVTGMTFEDYCGPKEPEPTDPPVPPAVDPCLIGAWVSDEWTIPGPPGVGLDLTGGAGISMMINREGLVTTDFAGMADMRGMIPQRQSGTATHEITAAGGTSDVLSSSTEMNIGPGVFALWMDETRYECGTDSFTLINHDEVESVDIRIRFRRA